MCRIANSEPALAETEARGASRSVVLPVTVASQTPLLHEASGRCSELLRQQRITATRIPRGVRLLSGIDGARNGTRYSRS